MKTFENIPILGHSVLAVTAGLCVLGVISYFMSVDSTNVRPVDENTVAATEDLEYTRIRSSFADYDFYNSILARELLQQERANTANIHTQIINYNSSIERRDYDRSLSAESKRLEEEEFFHEMEELAKQKRILEEEKAAEVQELLLKELEENSVYAQVSREESYNNPKNSKESNEPNTKYGKQENFREIAGATSIGSCKISLFCSCITCRIAGITPEESYNADIAYVNPARIDVGETIYIDTIGNFQTKKALWELEELRIDIYSPSHDKMFNKPVKEYLTYYVESVG